MKARLELLSPNECDQLHERTLNILSKTGMRVDTRRGRQILGEAGAIVNEASHIVRLPHSLVEEALRKTPKEFTLGGRRPAWDLPMNQGYCTLSADGGAVMVLDSRTGERRRGNREDWLASTRIIGFFGRNRRLLVDGRGRPGQRIDGRFCGLLAARF